ncbi:unnamed protein product [Pleuronectes platessa]|uniref:Uncharacterized protein n=1 Tax=Pleuronectes platessa TaxID=8262 RepID=A0A9N7U817_PLEPL|nr:unnamed protein product [Pleuronectes platessa]
MFEEVFPVIGKADKTWTFDYKATSFWDFLLPKHLFNAGENNNFKNSTPPGWLDEGNDFPRSLTNEAVK